MNPESFELTLAQQFNLRQMELSAQSLSKDEAVDLLLQATRLMMVKDNVIKSLLKP